MASRDTVLVVACTSTAPHGQDQLRRLSEQARARGVRLLGVDTADNLQAAWRMPVDETAALDFTDLNACRVFAARHREVTAVVTVKELGVLPAAVIAEELGLPGNDPRAVRTIRNKDLCRGVLRAAGFDQPAFAVVDGLDEATSFLAACSRLGPWIVKPRDGMGSAGVSLVRSAGDLPAALDALGSSAPFLIEEFVEGQEFSAEGVLLGGVTQILALTRKRTGAGFVETGHRTPAGLDAVTASAARVEVARAVMAAGLTHGIVHVEFWVTPSDGVILGELHARPGGDFIHALVEYTRPGFELYGTLLDDLLGNVPAELPAQSAAAGSEFLILGPGRVRSIEGWNQVAGDTSLIAAHLGVAPGDELGVVSSSADRHGVLVAGAGRLDEVDAALTRATSVLRIELGEA